MRILVVEDEHKIATSIKKGLEQESYIVDIAFNGIDGFDLASADTFDLIILDVMLPGMDGVTICKKLRSANKHVPILMLTAKGQVEDRIAGLNSGADDYLPKPFAFAELLARIRALLRRPKSTLSETLTIDDLTLNTITFEVKRDNKKIELSRREFALLEYMMRHPNVILSKDKIIESVWEYDTDILPNTVEVYIGYLRQRIDKAFPKKPPLITTHRGYGYKIGVK